MEDTPEMTEPVISPAKSEKKDDESPTKSIESKLKQLNASVGDDLRKQAMMLESLGSDDLPEEEPTPLNTSSLGSVSSFSSGASDTGEEDQLDPGLRNRKKRNSVASKSAHSPKGIGSEEKQRRVSTASDKNRHAPKSRKLSPAERDFFLRLEREWREEDAWAKEPGSWYSTLFWTPLLIWLRCINMIMSIVWWPIGVLSRFVFGYKMEYVPFWDVPIERRKQTAMVMVFVGLLPCVAVAYLWSFILLIFPLTTIPMALYFLFIFYWDKSPENGSRRPFIRYWRMWRHFASYFPLRLIKTVNLDPTRKYVFAYHPHGIISIGAFGCFGSDACGFSRKFPGIDLRLLTLALNFYCPFLREFLLHMGICSASRKSCDQILGRGQGSAIALVVGGAAESLETEPGTYRLTLRDRKGFVRVALNNGADLVPTIGMGENSLFDTLYYPPNSLGRKLQEFVRKKLGFATPIFYGRGMFNYSFGILPHRRPVVVVVGKPIRIPEIPEHLKGANLVKTEEGRALVDKYHQMYITELRNLWDLYKERWAVHRQGSLMIQR